MKKNVTVVFSVCTMVLVIVFISCKATEAASNTVSTLQTDTIPKRNLHGKARRIDPFPILLQTYFAHTWNGFETRNGSSIPIPAALILSTKDSADVYVAGFFNENTRLNGAVRGYMVIIEPQKVHLPAGDYMVQGNFILSTDFNTLSGTYTTQLKGKTDTCAAIYHVAQ